MNAKRIADLSYLLERAARSRARFAHHPSLHQESVRVLISVNGSAEEAISVEPGYLDSIISALAQQIAREVLT